MGSYRTIYRGYAIYVSGGNCSWSFRAEPKRPDPPIMTWPTGEGYRLQGAALYSAKREIDRLLMLDWPVGPKGSLGSPDK
jgi:hypothetical protein